MLFYLSKGRGGLAVAHSPGQQLNQETEMSSTKTETRSKTASTK